MKKAAKTIGQAMLRAEHFVVIVCCMAIVVLVFTTVLMRYVFKTSFQGMEELIMLFAFGIYFIGGALGSREETQITADVMSLVIKNQRSMCLLRAFQNLVDGFLIGVCTFLAGQETVNMFLQGSVSGALKYKIWIVYAVITVGLGLMTFYSLWHCGEYLVRYRSPEALEAWLKEKEGQS